MAGEKIPQIYCWKSESYPLIIYLASSERGAVGVGLSLDDGPGCIPYFSRKFPNFRIVMGKTMNGSLMDAVHAVLNGSPSPNLSLDIPCTPFQKAIWEKIALIPFGQTKTYGEVAESVGCRGGARAVGQALNRNPLPLIYP